MALDGLERISEQRGRTSRILEIAQNPSLAPEALDSPRQYRDSIETVGGGATLTTFAERERERIRWSIFGSMDYFTFYMLGMGRKWRKRKVWAEAWRLAGVWGLHSHERRSLPDASRAPRFPGDVCDELFTDTYCDITWFMWLDFKMKIQMTRLNTLIYMIYHRENDDKTW
jgi:hypothetical protein